MEMVKKTYQISVYALILCVYTIFFFVQFFFNFEGLSSSRHVSHYCSSHPTHETMASVKGQPLPHSGGSKIRLNKRFHQEDMPLCDVFSIVIPERYLPLQVPDHYLDIHLPSAVHATHPLRGPPAAA